MWQQQAPISFSSPRGTFFSAASAGPNAWYMSAAQTSLERQTGQVKKSASKNELEELSPPKAFETQFEIQPQTQLTGPKRRPPPEEYIQVNDPKQWSVPAADKKKKAAVVAPAAAAVAAAAAAAAAVAPSPDIEKELSQQNLYKTELCRSFEETGNCRYGTKCQFAHGRDELRPVIRHPKYKTEICKTFHSVGHCPYGKRCRFIHTREPLILDDAEETVTETPVSPVLPKIPASDWSNSWPTQQRVEPVKPVQKSPVPAKSPISPFAQSFYSSAFDFSNILGSLNAVEQPREETLAAEGSEPVGRLSFFQNLSSV